MTLPKKIECKADYSLIIKREKENGERKRVWMSIEEKESDHGMSDIS
jgi:hypothetical protein